MAEIRGRRPRAGERFLGRGQRSHQLRDLRSAESSPSGVRAGASTANTFWSYYKSLENASSGRKSQDAV